MIIRTVFGLCLCLGVFCVLVYFLKKMQGNSQAHVSSLKLIARLPLSSKGSVCLFECEGQRYLVGVGSDVGPLTALADNPPADEVPKLLEVVGGC